MDIWLIATLNRLFIIDTLEKWDPKVGPSDGTLRWDPKVVLWGRNLGWDSTVYDKIKV